MHRPRAYKLPDEEQLELIPLADVARGGMGKVELARVASGRLAGKHVAVKRLNRELEKDRAYIDMFLDELWMTSRIKSPNVVGVEAWGHDKQGMYLAIELVQGVSLARLIKESRARSEPFSERTVACLLSQVCAGLEVAHEVCGDNGEHLGLVHRDLTPGNILVGFDGAVKIADFGIAKARSRLTETAGGIMKGKPAYIAPEQARGLEIDRRADLFSVGVMLYELLAGKRPWTGKDDLETLIAVTTTEPVDLAEHRRANEVFLSITRQCLRKNRDERPSTASEIRERLDVWRHEKRFVADDLASLSQFVTRNTPDQLAWFTRALSGALQKGGSTFKEEEEKRDRDRGLRSSLAPSSASASRPASGLNATIAMPEQRQSAQHAVKTKPMSMPAVRSQTPYPAFQPSAVAERRMVEPLPEIETVAPTMEMHRDAPPAMSSLTPQPPAASVAPSSPRSKGLASTVFVPEETLRDLTAVPLAAPPKATPAPAPRKKGGRGLFVVILVVLVAAAAAAYFLRGQFRA